MSWQNKAHKMIEQAAYDAWKSVNFNKTGKQYKKHRPYALPEWCAELIHCLNINDETEAKRIMMWKFLRDY